ncbi:MULTISPECIES: VOC family protein [Oceanisphaera]|uniref:VOC family protein n=1 Tax=Oceanisphaera ostreae TaxID=914151 RepID=A0ABW3KI25_9GAMM
MVAPTPALENILSHLPHFLHELEQGVLDHGLSPSIGTMDHVCYRALDNAEYLTLRAELAQYGEVLVEGMIGHRPIITFKLFQPLASPFGAIPSLELAAPKAGKQHTHGLEHGEIVVPNLQQLLSDYPWIPFNTKGLQGHAPEVTLSVAPYQIKFHCLSLADTIALEIAHNQVIPVPEDYFQITL